MNAIYREMAKPLVQADNSGDRKVILKKQRELASVYDETVEICNKYKDAVNNQRYIRMTLENPEALNKLYASQKQDKKTFIENLNNLAEETKRATKEVRKKAYESIRNYHISDMAFHMQLESASMQKN